MKQHFRDKIKEKIKSHSELEKSEKSAIIKGKLFSEEEFKKAEVVMFYVSLKDEVDTSSMIDETLEMGKKVCVPVVVKEEKRLIAQEIRDRRVDLDSRHLGIHQPKTDKAREIPLEDIDLVIVPGVAFDKKNVRLGRGHGYYDRFLCRLSNKTRSIGLAFDFQVLEDLPQGPHDIPVSKIITA